MPWYKRKSAPGCCLYCRHEYEIKQFHQGVSWCLCPGAVKAKYNKKYEHNKRMYAAKQDALGKVVVRREPRKRLKPSEAKKREEVTGVYNKDNRLHRCRCCGALTVNRWNCHTCLERIGSTYDLSIYVEGGYNRHVGAGLGG